MSNNLPSGATLQEWLADGEALLNSLDGSILPADAQALVSLGEKIVNAAVAYALKPAAETLLTGEVDAEQTAAQAAVDKAFPVK